ncbi:rhomboid domain-containing protein 3 [Stegostoma tigrinum]|uniref:rhomboid domain-containing protein 3 n=1 Tax=Stegostoma tigrinum TaxID=3053191 RepID=UPI00202B073B|nr:rhomboid domain-containing protein 3 [Stegostoma tigrinum]
MGRCGDWVRAGLGVARVRARVPSASAAFLALVLLLWLTGPEEAFTLTASSVLSHRQVYRLLSYCFSHGNIFALVINVALLVVLSSHLEQQLGTIRYFYLSILFAIFSALLYLLLGKLLSLDETPVCGFTTVQFAVVTLSCCSLGMKRTITVAAVPWIFLPVAYLIIPGSSVLLHICGIIVGLTYNYRFLFCLESSNSLIDSVERLAVCKFLQLNSWIPFIFSPAKYHLPVCNMERFHSVPEVYRTGGSSTVRLKAASDDCTREGNSYNIEMDSQQTETFMQTLPASDPHTGSPHTNYLQAELYNPHDFTHLRQLDSNYHPSGFYHLNPHDVYAAAPHGLLTDEDLLHAGIIASLRESGMDQNRKVEIPKSSVSSLRLQQLKQMGFSTEKAALALAASGKIEGAINLLVEDQVGDDAVVTVAKVKTTSK